MFVFESDICAPLCSRGSEGTIDVDVFGQAITVQNSNGPHILAAAPLQSTIASPKAKKT